MFLRLNRVQQGDRAYRYADLVESYRRDEDGRPAHRVVAKLGKLSDAEVASWRAVLQGLEHGQRVIVAPESGVAARPMAPEANLRYLDAAVLLELFGDWGLGALCDELVGRGDADVSPGAVVAALTLQRCMEPGSKLFASRWIPRTALPELLGVSPGVFNNTRIHRVLDGLSEVGDGLQQALARRLGEREGAFVSLFLDTTEATFEGCGPALAQKCRTKDGVVKRRISIPLLCNERGYPLRWDVLPGTSADCNVFVDVCQALADVPWARGIPVIVDRAAGTTETFTRLLDTGLHALTALVSAEKPAYAPELPCGVLEGLDDIDRDGLRNEASQRVERAGFTRVSDDLLVHDLGIVTRVAPPVPERAPTSVKADPTGHCADALELARAVSQELASGSHRSVAAAARAHRLSKMALGEYLKLLALTPAIQAVVAERQLEGLTLRTLQRLAAQPAEAQDAALADLLSPLTRAPAASAPVTDPARPLRVRAVAYFNPDIFVEKRRDAQGLLDRTRSDLSMLNERIAKSPARWTRDHAAAAADRILRKRHLVDVFTLRIHTADDPGARRYRVEAVLDEAAWARRRRHDGFTVLVAHPDLAGSAVDLCALYRKREMVEHDFRVIKSLVELHPVRHRVDHKVKAHVTLCMLALLLERTLRDKLGTHATTEQALETLATCHLNHFGRDGYVLTRPTDEQRRLLAALHMDRLADDAEVERRLTPR